jgi:hypothetical protein
MSLEHKRVKLELLRVQAGKADMEVKIEEQYENIKRLEDNLKIQSAKEDELITKLANTPE